MEAESDNDSYEFGLYKYEGSYVNGKLEGEGKAYYHDDGNYIEGTFKNGLFHGYGKSYFKNGKVEYEGEWIDGYYHGKGKQYIRSCNFNSKIDFL